MHRTQLYLDDELWHALRLRARTTGKTVSDLVRTAAREHYLGNLEKRREAMKAFAGIWKDRSEFEDSDAYVRRLRRGNRIERIRKA
ncbi:MAG: ribbon-helix-helix protein, CopG family [Bryobacteraceae bacterium]